MPTYVYECAKCGDEFELWQSFADEPLKKHPGCGGKVVKVLQPVGIVLKGSGFYKNDSRDGGRKKTDAAAKSESSSKSESKSDTTSGSKADSKTGSSGSGDSSSSSAKSDGAKKPSTPASKSA